MTVNRLTTGKLAELRIGSKELLAPNTGLTSTPWDLLMKPIVTKELLRSMDICTSALTLGLKIIMITKTSQMLPVK